MPDASTDAGRAADEARATLEHARAKKDEFVDFLSRLAEVESPTHHPETIKGVHALIGPALEELGFDVRISQWEGDGADVGTGTLQVLFRMGF